MFDAEVTAASEQKKAVAGNVSEVAERLAPGRACISVVSGHDFNRTGASSNLFPSGQQRENPGPSMVDSLIDEVPHARKCISIHFVCNCRSVAGEPAYPGPGSQVARDHGRQLCCKGFQIPLG